ncbi:SusD/RagB family nutrient-binding outer membrane lipoprotein [Chondrinema litorale]|uniref:SusD/RagB family nutrient-binding outer membrane lipoprotein n=1 Tax=Chondrinema litorale TaxID=2994555 RepID=UPI0025435199|nr:SusD/RagB family nutrient-binding outer membrane lipoprotein [Chondrinema litorale]UZR97577.1 SusD/RagB family nutrient-binding outer membrane lipoprotein [Chondrinema litorale]
MKNMIKIFKLIFIIGLVGSCTGDFDEINTDPSKITAESLDASFVGPAFANVIYRGLNQGWGNGISDDQGTYGLGTTLHSTTYVQYLSTTSTSFQTERYAFNDSWRARLWTRFYTLAVPALNTAYEAAEDAEDNELTNAVLDVWKVEIYHRMTDHFGPIPYFDAGNGGETVAYDSQEDIYADFFTLLDNAIEVFDANAGGSVGPLVGYDRIYDGNVDSWKLFANSLKLRLALRISDIDPSNAQVYAEEAVASGVMLSSSESAFYEVSDDTPHNLNIIATWGFRMSASMESILRGYNDPRIGLFYSGASSDGEYRGQPNGGGTLRDWDDDDTSEIGPSYAYDLSNSTDILVMTAAETYFNRAEGALNGWNMSGSAQELYETGIATSMDEWEVDSDETSTYIVGTTNPVEPYLVEQYDADDRTPPVQVPVAFDNGDDTNARTQIAVQKYLALFPESWEAWADLRRTDIQILYPLLQSDNSNISRYELVSRLPFVPNEYNTNAVEVTNAVQLLNGVDNGATKVWWDVN